MVLDHLQREREREREREVGTLLWKPWTRQVMKNVVPSCSFYYTETLTHSATFLFFIFEDLSLQFPLCIPLFAFEKGSCVHVPLL